MELNGDSRKLRRALQKARKNMGDFFSSITRLAKAAGAAIAAGLAAGLAVSIRLASRLEDRLTKSLGLFGRSNRDVQTFAQLLGQRVGRSASEVLNTINQIGLRLRALGAGQGEAAMLAQRLGNIAEVAASALDVDPQQVVRGLMNASRGRFRSVQQLGLVGFDEQAARRISERLNLDLSSNADQLKLLSRLLPEVERALRTDTLVQALEDGETASQKLARIQADISNKLTEIGQKVLPIFSNFLSAVMVVLDKMSNIESFGDAMGVLGDVLTPVKDAFVAVFNDAVANLHALFKWFLSDLSGRLKEALGRMVNNLRGALSAIPGVGTLTPLPVERHRTTEFESPGFSNSQALLERWLKQLEELGKATDEQARAAKRELQERLAAVQGLQLLRNAFTDFFESDQSPGGKLEEAAESLLSASGNFAGQATDLGPSSFNRSEQVDEEQLAEQRAINQNGRQQLPILRQMGQTLQTILSVSMSNTAGVFL